MLWGNDSLWRYGFNGGPRRSHRRAVPQLGPEALRVLQSLRRDGVALTSLDALTGDASLLARVGEHAARLEAARGDAGRGVAADKPFRVDMLDLRRPVVHPDDPFVLAALDDQLKGVVDTYFGFTTTVSDVNVWRNLPTTSEPVSSQLWHRDLREDRVLVKVFVYLEPVGDGGGPFSYARGTHLRGRAAPRFSDGEHDGTNYRIRTGPDADRLEARSLVATGPAGTVVIADMDGYHRGGMATTSSRLLLQLRYSSRVARRLTMLSAPDGVDPRAWRRHLAYDRRPAPR